MKVLGLNGWIERGHDASAALVVDGEIICAVEEERFSRVKHSYDSLPVNAIRYCLEYGKIDLDDIDIFAFAWDFPYLHELHKHEWMGSKEVSQLLFGTDQYASKIAYVNHHHAHASSAFYPSGFDKALVLVMDGQGELVSTSIWYGEGLSLKMVDQFVPSLGYFYSAITRHVGFKGGQEGKTMGLASYGRLTYVDALRKAIYVDDNGRIQSFIHVDPKKEIMDEQDETLQIWFDYLKNVIPPYPKKIVTINEETQPYADLAASAQYILEEIVLALVNKHAPAFGTNKVCIAGGIGLNCTVNGKILELPFIDGVFIQPASNDGGSSLGAALKEMAEHNEPIKSRMYPYLGPDFTEEEMKQAVINSGLQYKEFSDIEKVVAQLLTEDKIVAFFQGKVEFGPRALGNRSILASPAKPWMIEKLNTLKGREVWRPLAPLVIDKYQAEYFSSDYVSPFMTITFGTKEITKEKAPSIVHSDNTARIQTVTKEYNPKLYSLMEYFYDLTGLPIIINTSFNTWSEPIILTPENAIRSFIDMKLDYLAIGNFLLENVK